MKLVPIEAFEVEFRIRNNAIKQRRAMLRLNQAQLAKKVGVCQGTINAYETLKHSPIHAATNKWKDSALKLAKFFKIDPEQLWPDVTKYIAQTTITQKLSAREMQYIFEQQQQMEIENEITPERLLLLSENQNHIEEQLNSLPARYCDVVKRRHGFNGEESQTLRGIGKSLGITQERVRQIELKAYRMLQWRIKNSSSEEILKYSSEDMKKIANSQCEHAVIADEFFKKYTKKHGFDITLPPYSTQYEGYFKPNYPVDGLTFYVYRLFVKHPRGVLFEIKFIVNKVGRIEIKKVTLGKSDDDCANERGLRRLK